MPESTTWHSPAVTGPVDPDTFKTILEGNVPDGSGRRLGRGGRDSPIVHRPGRDLTFSAPKSVSLAALVGGDSRIVGAHDRAVKKSLDWLEKNAAETRMRDPSAGRMVRAGNQKTVVATFRHDTSRNLDPQLHTHAVIANMLQGEDGKPFVQLQQAGMKTAVMSQIMRQRDPEPKAAVEASLGGDIKKAFQKLGSNIAEVKPDNLAGAAAARWLKLSPRERENAGLMAPSHALRQEINAIVRERLVRDGKVTGPALVSERLISRGYTHAEKSMAANYAPGDVVAFHRPYKRLGVEKGDELQVHNIDRRAGTVNLRGKDGLSVNWDPGKLAARTGGVEVYRSENLELRQGDRIRWTRNDKGLGLINSQTAEVARVKNGTVTFGLEDGRMLELKKGDTQLRHIDRAWASTVHAFQGRTVDTAIAAMEANHPHLTTQKTLYVEISRARDRASKRIEHDLGL